MPASTDATGADESGARPKNVGASAPTQVMARSIDELVHTVRAPGTASSIHALASVTKKTAYVTVAACIHEAATGAARIGSATPRHVILGGAAGPPESTAGRQSDDKEEKDYGRVETRFLEEQVVAPPPGRAAQRHNSIHVCARSMIAEIVMNTLMKAESVVATKSHAAAVTVIEQAVDVVPRVGNGHADDHVSAPRSKARVVVTAAAQAAGDDRIVDEQNPHSTAPCRNVITEAVVRGPGAPIDTVAENSEDVAARRRAHVAAVNPPSSERPAAGVLEMRHPESSIAHSATSGPWVATRRRKRAANGDRLGTRQPLPRGNFGGPYQLRNCRDAFDEGASPMGRRPSAGSAASQNNAARPDSVRAGGRRRVG